MHRNLELLIPLTSIVLGIGVAFWAMYLKHKQRMMLFEERRLAIEKGLPVPEIPAEPVRVRDGRGSLKWGLIFLFFGIGLALVSAVVEEPEPAVFGILFGMLGLANLVYYAVAGRKAAGNGASKPLL